MVAIFAFLLIIILVFIGVGVSIYRRQIRNIKAGQQLTPIPFRWIYIMVPLIFLFVTIVFTAYYYGKIPSFDVPYRFDINGVPTEWAINALPVAAAAIGIQVVLVLVSFSIVFSTRRIGMAITADDKGIKPSTIIAVMGNLPAFLQLVSFFYTLDVYNFAAYQKHLFPMWLFLVVILVLATAGFIAFTIVIALRTLKQSKS